MKMSCLICGYKAYLYEYQAYLGEYKARLFIKYV